MWARSEERGASMRWRTAVCGSGFKGHISIRETYQVLSLLDFTQREAVENPCGLDISFPDVDTGLILCVQQNIPTVVDLFPFFRTDFVEDLPAPLPLFCTCFALSKLTERFRARCSYLHLRTSCMDSTWTGVLWGLQWCSHLLISPHSSHFLTKMGKEP